MNVIYMPFDKEKLKRLTFFEVDMEWEKLSDMFLLNESSLLVFIKAYFDHVFSIKGPLFNSIKCRILKTMIENPDNRILELMNEVQTSLYVDLGSGMNINDKIETMGSGWSKMWVKIYEDSPMLKKAFPPLILEGKRITPEIPPVWFIKKAISSVIANRLVMVLSKQFGLFDAEDVKLTNLNIDTEAGQKIYIARTFNSPLTNYCKIIFARNETYLKLYKLINKEDLLGKELTLEQKTKTNTLQAEIGQLLFQNVCLYLYCKYKNIGGITNEIFSSLPSSGITRELVHSEQYKFLQTFIEKITTNFVNSIKLNPSKYEDYLNQTRNTFKFIYPPCLDDEREISSPEITGEVEDIKSKEGVVEVYPTESVNPSFNELIYFRDIDDAKADAIPSTKILSEKEKKLIIKSVLNKEFREKGNLESYLTDHYQLISSELEDQSEEIVRKKVMIFLQQFQNYLILHDYELNVEGSYMKKYDAYVNHVLNLVKSEEVYSKGISKEDFLLFLNSLIREKMSTFLIRLFKQPYDETVIEEFQQRERSITLETIEDILKLIYQLFPIIVIVGCQKTGDEHEKMQKKNLTKKKLTQEQILSFKLHVYVNCLLYNLIKYQTYDNLMFNIRDKVLHESHRTYGLPIFRIEPQDRVDLIMKTIDQYVQEDWKHILEQVLDDVHRTIELKEKIMIRKFEKEMRPKEQEKIKQQAIKDSEAAAKELLLEEAGSKPSKKKPPKSKAKKSKQQPRSSSVPISKSDAPSPVQFTQRPESQPAPIVEEEQPPPKLVEASPLKKEKEYGCHIFTPEIGKICLSGKKGKSAFKRWLELIKQVDEFKVKNNSVFTKPILGRNQAYVVLIAFLGVYLNGHIKEAYKYAIKGGCLRDIISGDQINDLDISLYDKSHEAEFIALVDNGINEFVKLATPNSPLLKSLGLSKLGKVNKIIVELNPDKKLEIEISSPEDFASAKATGPDDLRIYDLDINQIVLDLNSKESGKHGYFGIALPTGKQIELGVRLDTIIKNIISHTAIILKPPNIIYPTAKQGGMGVQFTEIQKLVERQRKHNYNLQFPTIIKRKYGDMLCDLMVGSIYKMALGSKKDSKLTALEEKYGKDAISFVKIVDLVEKRDAKIAVSGTKGYAIAESEEKAGSKPSKKKGGTRKKITRENKKTRKIGV